MRTAFFVALLWIAPAHADPVSQATFLLAQFLPESCPNGMVMAGVAGTESAFCVETTRRVAVPYEDAVQACATASRRVCSSTEWYIAARQNLDTSGSLGLTNMCNGAWAWEWTGSQDHASGSGYLEITRGGNSANCQTKSWSWSGQHNNYSAAAPYRCCSGGVQHLFDRG